MELTMVSEVTDASLCMDDHIIRLYCSRRPVTAPILKVLVIILWSEPSLSTYVARQLGHVEARQPELEHARIVLPRRK